MGILHIPYDEGSYSLSELESLKNLVAAIFRLENEPIQEINDLMEIKAMLAQTVSKMTAPWIQQGQEIGERKGQKIGEEIGERNGEKKMLFFQIDHRFNKEISLKAQSLISPIQSTDILEKISQWLLDCKDGDEFLKQISNL